MPYRWNITSHFPTPRSMGDFAAIFDYPGPMGFASMAASPGTMTARARGLDEFLCDVFRINDLGVPAKQTFFPNVGHGHGMWWTTGKGPSHEPNMNQPTGVMLPPHQSFVRSLIQQRLLVTISPSISPSCSVLCGFIPHVVWWFNLPENHIADLGSSEFWMISNSQTWTEHFVNWETNPLLSSSPTMRPSEHRLPPHQLVKQHFSPSKYCHLEGISDFYTHPCISSNHWSSYLSHPKFSPLLLGVHH